MQFDSTAMRRACSRVRRICYPALLALAVSATPACHRNATSSAPRVTLEVTNRGFFDVNVFVVKSPVATARRLGQVSGGMSSTFRVPETDLQAGQMMVLQVRTIAGQTAWTSPSLVVSAASVAKLDVVSTSSGDLSQSRFYTQLPGLGDAANRSDAWYHMASGGTQKER